MSSVWKLDKYARYLGEQDTENGKWQFYDSEKLELNLTLTDTSFLVICHGTTVVESHSLATARSWMRGIVKEDSMIFMYRIKGNTRKFRVKFKSGDTLSAEETCRDCVKKMSEFFPVKISCQPKCQSQDETQDPDATPKEAEVVTLEGEIPISKMAEVITGRMKFDLPKAYNDHKYPTEETGILLRLCLADPAFPGFVEQVEKQLKEIMSESPSDS